MLKRAGTASVPGRWADAVFQMASGPRERVGLGTLGVLPGEGIGPEVVAASLEVLSATGCVCDGGIAVRTGGRIGREAEMLDGKSLTPDVAAFCDSVFAEGGAVLAGAGGGRFVYDLRRRFDLFCKISPVQSSETRPHIGRLEQASARGVDLLVVRENSGGVYMGPCRELDDPADGRVCEQSFRYSEREVRRIVEAAARLAAQRRGELAVIVKDGGMPAMTSLWRDTADDTARRSGIRVSYMNVDLAAYAVIDRPRDFDVMVAPDLFGDVLADVAAILIGGRGFSFSGNFSASGAAVYQTNHGSAADIAGSDRANPIGQIRTLAMALRESFGLAREADWIDQGIDEVLRLGFRTFDIAEDGKPVIGTREMGEHIASAVARIARSDS